MTMTLANPSIAILVANGFDESHITAVQRSLTKSKVPYKMIAPEQGLVNGWQDNAWGHYFTVDESISTAMGSDYDVLVLIGGERGVAKLKANPHARRIVNHFMEAGKPVAAIGSGVGLLALSVKSMGIAVSAPTDVHADLTAAQVEISEEALTVSGSVMTSSGVATDAWVDALATLIDTVQPDAEAVAA